MNKYEHPLMYPPYEVNKEYILRNTPDKSTLVKFIKSEGDRHEFEASNGSDHIYYIYYRGNPRTFSYNRYIVSKDPIPVPGGARKKRHHKTKKTRKTRRTRRNKKQNYK